MAKGSSTNIYDKKYINTFIKTATHILYYKP